MCAISLHKKYLIDGLTLIELIVTIVIIGVFVALTMVVMHTSVENARLRSAAETLWGDLRMAKTEAISSQRTIYIDINTGTNWCYGLSDATGCDCSASSCAIHGVLEKNNYENYIDISLATSNISGELAINPLQGDFSNGLSASPATITLTSTSGNSAIISLTDDGKITLCANDLSGIPAC